MDFAAILSGRFVLRPQGKGDLGVRLKRFLTSEIAGGADSVVVVGADSPTLPVEYVERAFAELQRADVVLGPATDGGYYLLGCGRRIPPVLDGLIWGGSRVLIETLARLPADNWKLAVLPPWYDVDTLDDWHTLRGHVAALAVPVSIPVCRTPRKCCARIPDDSTVSLAAVRVSDVVAIRIHGGGARGGGPRVHACRSRGAGYQTRGAPRSPRRCRGGSLLCCPGSKLNRRTEP